MNRILFIFLSCLPVFLSARMAPHGMDAQQQLIQTQSTPSKPVAKRGQVYKQKKQASQPVADLPARWKPVAVQKEKQHDEIPGTVMVNRIEAEVDGPNGPAIITTLDVERRQFDGQQHTVDDLIQEHLKAQRSQKIGATVSRDDVLRYLRTATGDKNFSDENLEQMGMPWSFTLDEIHDELARMYQANMSVDIEIRQAVERLITEDDIQQYDLDHPLVEKGTLYVQTAFVPVASSAVEKMLADDEQISWGGVIAIDFEDIAPEKAFLLDMQKGEIKLYPEGANTRVYKIVDRQDPRKKPLEERKSEIIAKIREARFNQAAEKAKEALLAEAKVFYKK